MIKSLVKNGTEEERVKKSGKALVSLKHCREILAAVVDDRKTIQEACKEKHLCQLEFWRMVLRHPELRREMAAIAIAKPYSRADAMSADGNVAALSTFAKLGKDMASSLAPSDWGDKVQVEGKHLIIHCNLFSQDEVETNLSATIEGQVIEDDAEEDWSDDFTPADD